MLIDSESSVCNKAFMFFDGFKAWSKLRMLQISRPVIREDKSLLQESTIPLFKYQKTQRSINYTSAKIWNSIPIWIKK